MWLCNRARAYSLAFWLLLSTAPVYQSYQISQPHLDRLTKNLSRVLKLKLVHFSSFLSSS